MTRISLFLSALFLIFFALSSPAFASVPTWDDEPAAEPAAEPTETVEEPEPAPVEPQEIAHAPATDELRWPDASLPRTQVLLGSLLTLPSSWFVVWFLAAYPNPYSVALIGMTGAMVVPVLPVFGANMGARLMSERTLYVGPILGLALGLVAGTAASIGVGYLLSPSFWDQQVALASLITVLPFTILTTGLTTLGYAVHYRTVPYRQVIRNRSRFSAVPLIAPEPGRGATYGLGLQMQF